MAYLQKKGIWADQVGGVDANEDARDIKCVCVCMCVGVINTGTKTKKHKKQTKNRAPQQASQSDSCYLSSTYLPYK